MTLIHVWFGGRFSPPTSDHIRTIMIAIHELRNRYGADAQINIYFVPISSLHNKPSVHESCVSEGHRLKMLGLEIAKLQKYDLTGTKYHLSTVDIDAPVAFKTIDSVQALMAKHGILNTMGVDEHMYIALEQCSMEKLLGGEWFMAKELINSFKYIVFPKDPNVATDDNRRKALLAEFVKRGHRIGAKNTDFMIVPSLGAGADSASARKAIRDEDEGAIRRYLIDTVADYILANELYRSMACEGPQCGGSKKKSKARSRRHRIKSTRKRR
jgi:nicotinic acid mononucleotide adenylyltransferase